MSIQSPIGFFSHEPDQNDLGRLMETAEAGLERYGYVVAVYPSWAAEPALQRLETLRSMLDAPRLVPYGTSLPPLAAAVLAALISAVDIHVASTGALIAALPALERELFVFAWLAGVSRLSEPAPSLMQHAASLAPRTRFGVSFWPSPEVKRLSRKDSSVPVPPLDRPVRVAIANRDGDVGWVYEQIVARCGSPPALSVPPTPLGPEWWGTSKLTEAVVYPVDTAVTAQRITAELTARLCTWCGESIASSRCPFCRMETAPETAGAASE